MRSFGNNFNQVYFPENQLTKFSAVYTIKASKGGARFKCGSTNNLQAKPAENCLYPHFCPEENCLTLLVTAKKSSEICAN